MTLTLDYSASKDRFFMRVPRSDSARVQSLMREHGFDLSLPASTAAEAVLFTPEPYAAAAFGEFGTEAARNKLAPILAEINASWANDSGAHVKCPADKELWPFQRASIAYARRRQNTLVGDQPGLGKTPIAICFANEICAKRVLVLCPANIRLQWVQRIREWTTMRWPYTVHPILTGKNGVHPNAEWTVVSFDLARTPEIGRQLARGLYDLLIIDEAHYLKENTSKRTRAVFGGGLEQLHVPFADRCGAILALTGTPLPNRPREAYTLARGLCFDSIDYMSEDRFKERFNPSHRNEVTDPESGRTKIFVDERSGRHAELQSRMRANFMVRHLKREVMPQLKLPIYDIIELEQTQAIRQALQAESLLEIDPEEIDTIDVIEGHIAEVRRLMGVAMAPQVADYVDMLIDGGEENVVVFAWHIEVLNILERAWQRHGVLRIDGSTSAKQKQARVDEFRTDPRKKIIVGNMQSMGTGTDGLQEVAWHALIAEPDWVPGNNIQAFDRLDRGGQRAQVQGDIFVAPESIAAYVLASALRKLNVTNKALDARVRA